MNMFNETWRRLPFGRAPAQRLLAEAQALLAGLAHDGRPALRWYEAGAPALILGSAQKPTAADLAACAAASVTVHRRTSGGTAVFFEAGFLMLDVALPATHPLRVDDVTRSYRWLGECWQAALAMLGLPARLVSIDEARSDSQALDPLTKQVCFGGRSPFEVMDGERKLVGLSQVRRREGALLQVGLYTHWSPYPLVNLLALTAEERPILAAALRRRVGALNERLPDTAPTAVIDAFHTILATRYGVQLNETPWSTTEEQAVNTALPRFAAIK